MTTIVLSEGASSSRLISKFPMLIWGEHIITVKNYIPTKYLKIIVINRKLTYMKITYENINVSMLQT